MPVQVGTHAPACCSCCRRSACCPPIHSLLPLVTRQNAIVKYVRACLSVQLVSCSDLKSCMLQHAHSAAIHANNALLPKTDLLFPCADCWSSADKQSRHTQQHTVIPAWSCSTAMQNLRLPRLTQAHAHEGHVTT